MKKILFGATTYVVYSIEELFMRGFQMNPNAGPDIFTHCPVCKEYCWFKWLRHPVTATELVVCNDCQNAHTAIELTETVTN